MTVAGQSSSTSVKVVISRVAESTQAAVAQQRPWSQLLDRTFIEKPESYADASDRMKKNISYFRMNYIIFMLIVIGLSLLWHPVSLIVLAILVVAWIHFYFGRTEPVFMFNRTFSEKEVLVILGLVTIVALYFTSAGSNLTWALVIGCLIVCILSACRRTDDIFLDEEESSTAGLLRFPTV